MEMTLMDISQEMTHRWPMGMLTDYQRNANQQNNEMPITSRLLGCLLSKGEKIIVDKRK
jgi:hypothetical protein